MTLYTTLLKEALRKNGLSPTAFALTHNLDGNIVRNLARGEPPKGNVREDVTIRKMAELLLLDEDWFVSLEAAQVPSEESTPQVFQFSGDMQQVLQFSEACMKDPAAMLAVLPIGSGPVRPLFFELAKSFCKRGCSAKEVLAALLAGQLSQEELQAILS